MLPKEQGKKISSLENPKTFKKEVVTVDPSSANPRRKKQKSTTSFMDCSEFSSYLEKAFSESMPKRRLAAMYLAI